MDLEMHQKVSFFGKKKVIQGKYREEKVGWCSYKVREGQGLRVWKTIKKVRTWLTVEYPLR